jgi:hypothetical protein
MFAPARSICPMLGVLKKLIFLKYKSTYLSYIENLDVYCGIK